MHVHSTRPSFWPKPNFEIPPDLNQYVFNSVPMDLANWGPSGPAQTTKILWTGPNGPETDLPEKQTNKIVQKHAKNLTMLNAHVWFAFES